MEGFGYNLIFAIAPLFFIVIFGVMIVIIVKNIIEWSKNNRQPIMPVTAKVVAKRTQTTSHHSGEHTTGATTTYYATFEFANGERTELSLKGRDYAMLSIEDKGTLEIQGTRFISFTRDMSVNIAD